VQDFPLLLALGLCSVVFKGIIVFEGTMVCMLGSVLYFRW
jgi:hypothetical protein